MRSRGKTCACEGVPNREGEISVQLRNAVLTELVVQMENNFGIAARAEDPALRLQGIAKLDIVEDLSVEDNSEATLRKRHRLLTVAQTNDRETSMTQPNASLEELALFIRPAMGDGLNH